MKALKEEPKNQLSPYNISHNEINNGCCGIFCSINAEKIVCCNECGKTIKEALEIDKLI